MELNVSTGNRAIFKIRGQIIGLAQNVSFSDDFGLQDVDWIGELESLEFVPGKLAHTISGSSYFVKAATLVNLGFIPRGNDWLKAPEFEVEIIDKGGETVELYTGCKFASHSREYSKHTITGQSWSMRGLHKEI